MLMLISNVIQNTLHQMLVMFHLKYLSLTRTKVHIIPRSIGNLQNLETLDLKHTLVSEMPVEITKLKKLQYLLVYNYAKFTSYVPFRFVAGFPVPHGIGALASPQKFPIEATHWLPLLNNLAVVHLGWSKLKSSPLIALQNLPNLMKLDLYLANLESMRFLSMNGHAMPFLQKLSIDECRHLDWQSVLVFIHGLTLLTNLRFYGMPKEFALAFYLCSSSIMMGETI
ncbi:hypothetical protein EUGRSUZ_H04281 [Eucalyptus grandis]|uniref:Uncharacterized protein n=2 Tax=Eucalyptus grandis TaxID=71139 RepID=A0ACC3JXJ6_EUCGR|nr:hypothetical protein EUGRSUZ_H04281 [Eucalyptus grandis]